MTAEDEDPALAVLLGDGVDKRRQRGIPHLPFEADIIDPESFSFGQIKLRIQAFVEMLQSSGVT